MQGEGARRRSGAAGATGRSPVKPPQAAPAGAIAGVGRGDGIAGEQRRGGDGNAAAPKRGIGGQSDPVALHLPFNVGEDMGGGSQRGHGGEGEGKQLGDLAGGVQAGQRGEFPKGGQQAVGRALGDLYLPGAAQQQNGFLLLAAAGLFLAGGQRKLRPGGVGHTQVLHRAPFAQGAAVGQADERPQFHQRLVKVPDTVLRQHLPDGLAEFLLYGGVLDVASVVHEAGGHPQHVAVHGGHPQVKGDGGDGPGGVFAQTGEPA